MKIQYLLTIVFSCIVLAFTQMHDANAQFSRDNYTIFGGYEPGTGYNGRYFNYGDTVKLEGNYYALTNSTSQLLNNTLVDVILHKPDGSTISVLKDYFPEKPGHFSVEIHVDKTFLIGKYYFDFSAHKKGQSSEPNENQSPFYVVRVKQFVIPVEGKEYSVKTESIEQQVSNVRFDNASKSLIFDIDKISGRYAADGDLQFANTIGVTIQRPLLSPSFYVVLNNKTGPTLDYDVQITSDKYFVGINTDELQGNGTVTLIGTYAAPEFPVIVPVMLIGIVSAITLYRVIFRK